MTRSASRLFGLLLGTFAATALATIALPLPARANVVTLDACDGSTLTQPFARWADYSTYKLDPGADFEGSLAGWALEGGAARASGSETYGVAGSVGSSSLSLPSGASAISPQTCVDAAYPDFRLFARAQTPGATVAVSVLYGGAKIPVGVVAPGANWEPTLPLATGSAIAGAIDGGSADLAIRFTAMGGTVQIDDVFVDPHSRCC